MLKNPFEALHQLMKDKFDRDRVMIEFAHTQSDSMVTWLIGFAITGLTLILVNIDKIQSNLENALTPISVLLCLTICLGLIYRYLSPIIVIKQKRLQDFLSGIFADFDVTPIEADPEVDTASFDDILRKLKSDFDVDTPYPFQLTETQKASELPKLVNHYREWCKHSKRQFDIAVNHWAEVNETVYKIPKNKTVEKFQKVTTSLPQTGFNLRRWTWLNGILYLLCINQVLYVGDLLRIINSQSHDLKVKFILLVSILELLVTHAPDIQKNVEDSIRKQFILKLTIILYHKEPDMDLTDQKKKLSHIYDIRSSIAHGGELNMSRKDLQQMVENLFHYVQVVFITYVKEKPFLEFLKSN